MIDSRVLDLAKEYLEICRLMQSGAYDGAEYQELSRQRTTTHDELIRVLGPGHARPFDMKAYCRQLLDT